MRSYEAGQLSSESLASSDPALNGLSVATGYDSLARRDELTVVAGGSTAQYQTIAYGSDGRLDSVSWGSGYAD
jgi:hypothetical protein